MTLPLAYTGTAGIGHDDGSDAAEVLQDAVALCRLSDLFRARIDDELSFHGDVLLVGLTGYGCCTAKILIAGVGAGADESTSTAIG